MVRGIYSEESLRILLAGTAPQSVNYKRPYNRGEENSHPEYKCLPDLILTNTQESENWRVQNYPSANIFVSLMKGEQLPVSFGTFHAVFFTILGHSCGYRAENIVITRQMDYQAEGATVVHSVEEALNAAARYDTRDVFVIGGGEVYRSLLPYCDTAYITKIDFAYDADTRLPDLDHDPEWEKVRATDELTYFDLVYEFDTYRRK